MRVSYEKRALHTGLRWLQYTQIYATLTHNETQCSRTFLRQQTRSQKGNYGCEVHTYETNRTVNIMTKEVIIMSAVSDFEVSLVTLRRHGQIILLLFGSRVTIFPHIVSSIEYFPPLNCFSTLVQKLFKFSLLHKRKTDTETI